MNSKKEFLTYCPERNATFERQIKTSEDAPPLAHHDHVHNRTILGVADGMGGAGTVRVVPNSKPSTPQSMARVASRSVVGAVLEGFNRLPRDLSRCDLTTIISENVVSAVHRLTPGYRLYSCLTFSETAAEFAKEGIGILRYPTTLATAIIQKEADRSTIVHALWGGDAPISIRTPTSLFTTYNGPSSGNDHAIHADVPENYQLHKASFYIPADVPFMVAACTDGLTHFNRFPKNMSIPHIDRLDLFRELWTSVVKGTDRATLSDSLQMCIAPYLDTEACYLSGAPYLYPDDRTASLHLSQSFVPQDEISTHLVGNGDNFYII